MMGPLNFAGFKGCNMRLFVEYGTYGSEAHTFSPREDRDLNAAEIEAYSVLQGAEDALKSATAILANGGTLSSFSLTGGGGSSNSGSGSDSGSGDGNGAGSSNAGDEGEAGGEGRHDVNGDNYDGEAGEGQGQKSPLQEIANMVFIVIAAIFAVVSVLLAFLS
mmetsp:Transcript_28326/g.72226  ORF Transcript_28326/g.72226 Transcript_28326/m.72226 type:complete len:163 (-) Transcript_28326:94-582(-)